MPGKKPAATAPPGNMLQRTVGSGRLDAGTILGDVTETVAVDVTLDAIPPPVVLGEEAREVALGAADECEVAAAAAAAPSTHC